MVVTRTAAGWKRLLLVCLLSCASLITAAPSALAQEDPAVVESTQDEDPSLIESLAGCALNVSSGAGLLVDVFANDAGADSPGCGDVASAVIDAPATYVKNAASGAFEAVGLSFGDAGVSVLKFALGWWITIPGQDENSFMNTLGEITQYTYWLQVAFLTVSLMFLGIRLMMARSGAIRDVSTEGFQQLARATVLSGSIGFIVVLGTRLSDNVSRWFIEGTVGADPDALVEAMIQIGLYATPGGVALLFVIGIIGILGGLMMAFLLLMRMGLLVVIAAALPIAGAAGGTKIGSQAYEKMIAWTIAFLLFKPVGSFVIGVAAMLFLQSAPSSDDNGGALTAVVGALLLCSAALVLPSLMRLIVPAVGAVGGGGSGVAAAAGAAAVGAKVGGMVATGGASAGAGAASGATSGMSSMGAGSSSMATGASASAPASFGTAGQGGAAGGADGTPSGGNAAGGADGTPSGQGGAPGGAGGSGDHEASADGMVGAMPASNGGFEG
ncbi:hypothetical protein [Rhodococcus marinonascens]|uniref:hypothetical protein n=1 Tax=Rhodococcus marinonascens TaxID=38311 RepID=UPI00093279BB|nr:hypothetical protein [Rhodococcus marinonascens]